MGWCEINKKNDDKRDNQFKNISFPNNLVAWTKVGRELLLVSNLFLYPMFCNIVKVIPEPF